MRTGHMSLAVIVVFFFTSIGSTSPAAERPPSEWVRRGADGKLTYKTTPRGDRIMDFSHAGYRGGGVALPDVAVQRTVKPSGGGGADDTQTIQAALDEVAKLPPDEQGFRGAVLLAPGTFSCAETIQISGSGVVLRGSGSDGAQRSTIKMTGNPHLAIAAPARRGGVGGASQPASRDEASGSRTTITDAYVPSGAISFNVADAKGFDVGDTIAIRRPVTRAWVEFMQMHDMTRDGKPQTWIKVGSTTTTERTIAAIDRNKITLDVPLSDSFDAEYLNPPGTVVEKLPPSTRLARVGIENLHIESPLQPISHSKPHHTAIRLTGEDCWIRNVVADETMNSIAVGGRRITVQDAHVNRKAKHEGASKPAELAPNGSQVLLDRCTVTGENVWHVATGGGHAGPIVVLNSIFTGSGKSESHQRWSTGLLYDNCRAIGGGFEMRNRGSMGSGHGWSMGWGVLWNCVADNFLVQNPPGAHNWMIGCVGEIKRAARPWSGPDLPGGTVDSHGTPVAPPSLYLAQLEERLGADALKNIGYDPAKMGATLDARP